MALNACRTSSGCAPRMQRARALLRHVESGSMDAGSTGDILFIPFLVTLVLIGLMVTMVGFWRVGSSYATQRSAQVGSVSPEQGDALLRGIWEGWTGGNMPAGGFAVNGRSVSSSIGAQSSFNMNLMGSYDFSVGAGGQLRVRSERFYPGQPVCDDEGCDE